LEKGEKHNSSLFRWVRGEGRSFNAPGKAPNCGKKTKLINPGTGMPVMPPGKKKKPTGAGEKPSRKPVGVGGGPRSARIILLSSKRQKKKRAGNGPRPTKKVVWETPYRKKTPGKPLAPAKLGQGKRGRGPESSLRKSLGFACNALMTL